MLSAVLAYLRNWFLVPGGIHPGDYSITSDGLELPFLQNNQYFRIVGSVFNDGVYKYPAEDLQAETFKGEVWAMAVPPALIELVGDIDAWCTLNATTDKVSESFGGYSYSRGTSASGAPISWQQVFSPRLRQWRKI